MIKHYFKLLTVTMLLFMASTDLYAQFYEIYQTVAIAQYKGKNFILEGKIYYQDEITNSSWVVLAARTVDENVKQTQATLYNENAGDYYKKGEWSSYELSGKIDKKAKYLAIGVAIAGSSNYYLDDFKLYIKDGKNKVEIPLKNGDFEGDSLSSWRTINLDKNTTMALFADKAFSGKQSLFLNNSAVQVAPKFGNNPELGKYAEVNGIKLYYEIYGAGEPLLLLHGNNSFMGSFHKNLEELSKKYKVIALDSRGQGKSTDNGTKITYELMAEDVNAFLDQLQLKKVNVLGWSDGGNIAVILALQHPDKVNKMAIMGTVLYNNDSSVTGETNKLLHKQVKEMKEKGVTENNMWIIA